MMNNMNEDDAPNYEKDNQKQLIVNLFAGPGSGKSTMAANLFSKLKQSNINCEVAWEYAKDLVWENRGDTFKNQIYIFGKQHSRIFRLVDKVSIIITDSPLLLTPIYDSEKRESLLELTLNEHNKLNNLNFFINRMKGFNPKGRIHSKKESLEIDDKIKLFLNKNKIQYSILDGNEKGANRIYIEILKELIHNE